MEIVLRGTSSMQLQEVFNLLDEIRGLEIRTMRSSSQSNSDRVAKPASIEQNDNSFHQLESVAAILASNEHHSEAAALLEAHELGTTLIDSGGLGLREDNCQLSAQDTNELLFLIAAHLEALNSQERAKAPVKALANRPSGKLVAPESFNPSQILQHSF